MNVTQQNRMRYVLLAAAVCNIVLGAFIVIWPHTLFMQLSLPLPNYPELWQFTGSVAAVLGIGFGIAASDPLRHWPIALIGLLAKVLGPFGFAQAILRGQLPARWGWWTLANDVVWWVPLAMVLSQAWSAHCERLRSWSPEVLSFALRARTDRGVNIEQLSRLSPVLVVFLRHTGCTFCREALADLARQRDSITAAGARIVLVHMGRPEFGREFFLKYGLSDLPQISDPGQTLYRAFGLRRGTLRMLFGPSVWWRGFDAAIRRGHGVGKLAGDGFQMPGIFLVFHGQILRSYRHQSAADRPDYVRFIRQDLHEAVS